MSVRKWLTPDAAPEFECRALFTPVGRDWQAILRGCLEKLTNPNNFEQFGSQTPEQTAAVFSSMFDFLVKEDCPMFAGMIALAACSDNPSARWLLCDGRSLLKTDYPDLHAAIGDTFGSVDGDHFNIPDLQGRVPVGTGSGSGLTSRSLADSGGEETHVLILDEMPDHDHEIGLVQGSGSLIALKNTTGGSTSIGYTGASGSDVAHNNMQPWLALNAFIYAG